MTCPVRCPGCVSSFKRRIEMTDDERAALYMKLDEKADQGSRTVEQVNESFNAALRYIDVDVVRRAWDAVDRYELEWSTELLYHMQRHHMSSQPVDLHMSWPGLDWLPFDFEANELRVRHEIRVVADRFL